MLPINYKWLGNEPGPKILLEALKLFGTKEVPGSGDNAEILAWADEIGGWLASYYEHDSIAWCGLFVGICAKRAGYPFNQTLLGAKNWLEWGTLSNKPMLGDVLVFNREGGGHVGFYVAEDKDCYHVLGGNQSDAVTITRILKSRLVGARRCKWKIGQPTNIRTVHLKENGVISINEA